MKHKSPVLYLLFSLILIPINSLVFAQTKDSLVYAIKGKDTLRLDIYIPNNIEKDAKLPLLLWMHGGGFSGGQRDNEGEVELCEYAAQNGFVAASISYRLLRKDTKTAFGCNCTKEDKIETFREATIDYLDAANFLVKNSDRYHIDKDIIIAGGSSAGAEAVLSSVFMREFYVKDLTKYENVKFTGVFSLAGAITNADYITEENAIPSIFFHGTKDNLVPFGTDPHHFCDKNLPGYLMLDGSETIVEKLKKIDESYYFNIVKGGKHEISGIPFQDLDAVFKFIDRTMINNEKIQTTVIKETGK